MLNINCPLCTLNNYKEVKGYEQVGPFELESKIVLCNSCGHYYLYIKNDVISEDLYKEGAYKILDTRGSLFDKIISIDDNLIIKSLLKFKTFNKKLLDFGCGKGQFIYRASKGGWTVKGVETAKPRAEFGIDKYALDIEMTEYSRGALNGAPFNVITLFHVLEHLSNPKVLLKKLIDNNLDEGGYLVIEVPLFESIQSKIAGKRWLHLDAPYHISHFTKNSLKQFINELKITPKKYEYFSIHIGILGMVQSLMTLFGYNKMIIEELKFRRTKLLMLYVILILPLALLLELFAVLIKKGGVIRVYCKKE